MFLLKEFTESNHVSLLTEATDSGKKQLYIKGIFAEAELKNRNGRIYPRNVMKNAINEYITEYVSKNRALGELSHPENRPTVKPELASHRITELEFVDDKVWGKALILETPQGQIVKGLLDGGTQLGVSTRALGSVYESGGTTYVKEDLKIFSADIVADPSSINAWVNGINESSEWVVTDDGRILEKYKAQVNRAKLSESRKLELFSAFLSDISRK